MKIKKTSGHMTKPAHSFYPGQLVECNWGEGWEIGVIARNSIAGERQWCNLARGGWVPLSDKGGTVEFRLADGTYEVSN